MKSLFLPLVLGPYLILLVAHMATSAWQNPVAIGLLAFGLVTMTMVHRLPSALLTIPLIIGHMGIEWLQHARHGAHYGERELWIHGIHALFDLAFLWQILDSELRRFSRVVFLTVCVGISGLFLAHRKEVPSSPTLPAFTQPIALPHQHGPNNPIGFFILGGMIGCVGSHLIRFVRSRK